MEETGPEETKMETKVEEATALRLFLTDFSTGPEGTVKYGGLAAPEAQAYLNDVNPDVSKLCSVCDKPGSSTCGKCGLALYCSRDCQRLDWSVHKKFCASLKSTSSEARPTREHRRVVYFPMESEEPVLLWCKFETFPRETLVAEDPGLLRLVTVGLGHSSEPKSTQVILNATREMSPGRFGHVLCNISFCAEDDVPTVWDPCLTNKSINALAEPGYSTPLMGPVITYAASRDVTSDELAVLDITMQDIRHTAVYFQSRRTNVVLMNPNDVKGKSINAIMLCNPNEPYNKAMGVTYRLMEVQTLLDHPKANWYFIYWANYVGLRWCVRKHDPPPHQMTEKQMQRLQEYGLLHSNEAISQSEEDAATDRKKLGREPTIAPRTGEKRADPMPTTKWAGADTRWITLVTTAVKEGQQCAWHNEYRGRLVIAHVAGVSPHPQHFLAFNCYMDFTMASATDPTEAGFREFWRDFHKRLMASELRALRAAGKLGGGQKVALAAEGIPSPYWAEDMQDGYLALHICGSTG